MIGAIFLWLIFALLIGWVGEERTIGFLGSFLLSIFLSPVIAFIILLFIPMKPKNSNVNPITKTNMPPAVHITSETSVADELQKLIKLKEDNHLTEEEFNQAKDRLLKK